MDSYQQFREALQRGRLTRIQPHGDLILPEVPEDQMLDTDEIKNSFISLWDRQKNLCINLAFELALESWREIMEYLENSNLPPVREAIEHTNEAIAIIQDGYLEHQSWQNVGQMDRPWDDIFEVALDMIRLVGYTPDSVAMGLYHGQTEEGERERLVSGLAWRNLINGMHMWSRSQLTSNSPQYLWHRDRNELWRGVVMPFINVYILRDLTDVSPEDRPVFMTAQQLFVLNQWWAECLRHMPVQQGGRAEIEYFNF